MNLVDQIRRRIADALFSGFLTIFIALLVSQLVDAEVVSGTAFSSETYDILLTLSMLPLVLTLLGLGIAVFRAGPFGFVGFLFEWAGANSLFNSPDGSDLGVIVFGAVLVACGAFVWSWKRVIKLVIRSRKRRTRPPVRRR